jgi:hypothetical protein
MVCLASGRISRSDFFMTDSYRKKLAGLSFPEKVQILEQMREREIQIAKIREKLKAERLQKQQEKQSK